jgi:MFS family permease
MLGQFGWIPPCGSDAGAILGGFFSSRLVLRGYPTVLSRKLMMSAAADIVGIGVSMTLASSVWMVLAALTLCSLGVGMWACNLHALAADVFPRPVVATVHGTAGSAGAAGGIIFNSLVGYFAARHHYGAALVAFGLLLPLGVAPLWLWMRDP